MDIDKSTSQHKRNSFTSSAYEYEHGEIQGKRTGITVDKTIIRSDFSDMKTKPMQQFMLLEYVGNFIQDKLVALEPIMLNEVQNNNYFEDDLSSEFQSSLFSS